ANTVHRYPYLPFYSQKDRIGSLLSIPVLRTSCPHSRRRQVFKTCYVSSTQFKDRHLHDPSTMPPLHSRTRYIPPTLLNAAHAHAHALISGPTASDPRTPLEPVRERRPEICAMITYAPSHR
ncbi:uncharacterized protein CCOS01_06667, partial [Colletotrichum costaricense]